MERIPLAIVGCGGMGHRHLYGLSELERVGLNRFEIIGACDPVTENAESLANTAAEYFGRKPTVVSKIEELAPLGVAAVDITTTPRFHHSLAVQALHHGMHMMIEKPVGLTVRAATVIKKAAEEKNLVVSTAENYRRDPINRLGKALLDAGVIGQPRFMLHQNAGGGNRMLISVWRHQKDQSGVLLDVGVHFADIMEYYLGPATSVYAQTRLHESTRYNPVAEGAKASAPNPIYERFQRQMPASFTATAEDAAYATITFANGTVAQYVEDHAAHGKGFWIREIHGSKGSMDLPNDRSGKNIVLHLADGDGKKVIDDERILDFVPDLRLDKATATLFGGERLWRYEFPFEQIDRKLLAVEYDDLAGAILGEHPAEVDIVQGTRSVGLSYAMLESGVVGRVVTMDEILNLELEEYQKDINDSLDL